MVKIWKRKGRVTHSLPQTTEQEKVSLSHGVVRTTTTKTTKNDKRRKGRSQAVDGKFRGRKRYARKNKGQLTHGVVRTTREGRVTHPLSTSGRAGKA